MYTKSIDDFIFENIDPEDMDLSLVPSDHPLLSRRIGCTLLGEVGNRAAQKEWFQALEIQLIRRMREEKASGIACNQVGLDINGAIVPIRGVLTLVLNPQVRAASSMSKISKEGCLSHPGETRNILRRTKVVFSYTGINQKGELQTFLDATVWDAEAVVFEHEFDHLQGITLFNENRRKQ